MSCDNYCDTTLELSHCHGGKLIAMPGNPGVAGPAGPVGPAGPQGPAGADSTVAGPAGPAGPQGPVGAASTVPGPAGPTGPAGPAGKDGAPGAQGTPGLGIRYCGEISDVSQLPTNATHGDLWVLGNRDDNSKPAQAFIWNSTTSVWDDGGNIQGQQGPVGPAGPAGPTGPASTVPGPQGPVGPAGPAGPSSGVASVNGRTGAVVLDKTDVGLSNVDDTSDALKPISNATGAALSTKVNGATSAGPSPLSLWIGTKSQYDALANKASTCVYVVVKDAVKDAIPVDAIGVDTLEGVIPE